MDVLNFNLVQSGATATAAITADAAPMDGATAGTDFWALLALGLNSPAQDALQPQRQEDSGAETANVADAQRAMPSPEWLIALPQQLPTDQTLPAGMTIAPDAPQTDALAAQMTKRAHAAILPSVAENRHAAVVADETANIAASGVQAAQPAHLQHPLQNVDQRVEFAADPHSGQDIALEALRAHAGESTSRAEPLPHALQSHAAEARAPLSQPSALLEVQAPVSEPGFAQALSRQVVWMVDKDAQVAELRINPPELGPIEVRLTLTQDSAVAEFVSPHAEVRAAIENAIVRLRDAMAEAGIQLGEASVSAESFSQRADAEASSRQTRDGYRESPVDGRGADRSNESTVTLRRGLVDVFA